MSKRAGKQPPAKQGSPAPPRKVQKPGHGKPPWPRIPRSGYLEPSLRINEATDEAVLWLGAVRIPQEVDHEAMEVALAVTVDLISQMIEEDILPALGKAPKALELPDGPAKLTWDPADDEKEFAGEDEDKDLEAEEDPDGDWEE